MFGFLRDWFLGTSDDDFDVISPVDAVSGSDSLFDSSRNTDPVYAYEPTNIYHDTALDPTSMENMGMNFGIDNVVSSDFDACGGIDAMGSGSFDSGMSCYGTDSFDSSCGGSDSFGASSFGSDSFSSDSFGGCDFGDSSFGSNF